MYSYRHGFRGFAAKLTEEQAYAVAGISFPFSFYLLLNGQE